MIGLESFVILEARVSNMIINFTTEKKRPMFMMTRFFYPDQSEPGMAIHRSAFIRPVQFSSELYFFHNILPKLVSMRFLEVIFCRFSVAIYASLMLSFLRAIIPLF